MATRNTLIDAVGCPLWLCDPCLAGQEFCLLPMFNLPAHSQSNLYILYFQNETKRVISNICPKICFSLPLIIGVQLDIREASERCINPRLSTLLSHQGQKFRGTVLFGCYPHTTIQIWYVAKIFHQPTLENTTCRSLFDIENPVVS